MTPRPYQRTAIAAVLSYAAEHPTGRLLLVIPPRGGKTYVGAELVRRMAIRNGLLALWLAHREELLDEAVAHLVAAGIPAGSIGVIKAGRSTDPDAKVQVASEATLARRSLPMAHMVVTDEAHRDTAPRRRALRRAFPRSFLLGLSATPKPPPQRDLGDDYDALTVVVQPSELIHDGYLAPPTVYAPARDAVPDLRGVRVAGDDYRPDDLEALLVRQTALDDVVAEWARLAEGRTTIGFPVTIAHSRALLARFQAAGVEARHLDGQSPDRAAIVDGLRRGKIQVVLSVGVLSEGTNLPRVKCVLGVRPTCSLTLFCQQMMRCATPYEHVRPRVLDVVGNVYVHGLPHADRVWSLRNADSGRPIGASGGVVKRCPKCGGVSPVAATTCDGCGAPFVAPVPSLPGVPLHLAEFTPAPSKLAAERARLVEFARRGRFSDPEAWADRVLAAKHGEAAA